MNYWNIQLHPNNLGWNRERELLENHGMIGLGDWDEAARQQPDFEKVMAIGDVVLVKHGGSIIALVEVIGNYEYQEQTDELLWFQRRRKVKVLDWYKETYGYSVSPRKTLERSVGTNASTYQSIIHWIQRINNKKQMESYIKLLNTNYNLILTGAPGTGKTYLAKQIAAQMILGKEYDEKTAPEEEKDIMDEQCGFVQFHPSYDYTDFVEGLRPLQDESGTVGFERKNGVFKEFCAKAISSQRTNGVDNFEEAWNKLVNELNENDYIDVPFISNKSKTFRIELNEFGTGLANRTYQNDDYQKGEWIKGQSKFFNKDQLYNVYKGLSGVPSGGHDNYRRAIVDEMKANYGLKPYEEGSLTSPTCKPFVFIIDEINRGEFSKIFGELFFSIDPGYRGKKGIVQTQYQNMIEDGDAFKKGFLVPENVYIIGTMNDIDRSVESMDFAFRRRFAFVEVKASENAGMLDGKAWKDAAIKRMNSLNAEIEKIEGLSSAYHIGASYFLKLDNYNGDFEQLWKYHLDGLLREYLRGTQGVDENMKKLENAYNLTKTTADDSSQDNG